MKNFENYKDYFYDNTEILRNKLDIRDQEELNNKERSLVSLRISELNQNPIPGNFDFEHLKAINSYLFQDLYEWAGQCRKCEMEKAVIFCLYSNIEFFANSIFTKLQEDNYFINNTYGEKIAKLVDLFADINALHPFREGNGRTQREFIEELAKVNGINLDLTKIGQQTMIHASHQSINGNNSQLLDLFTEFSKPMSSQMQIYYISTLCNPKLAKKLINGIMNKGKTR